MYRIGKFIDAESRLVVARLVGVKEVGSECYSGVSFCVLKHNVLKLIVVMIVQI